MSDDRQSLARCQELLGYTFKDESILVQALTHASSNSNGSPDNERMEFLGDAVVGIVVCDYLFRNYPQHREGQLTRMKSAVVSRSALGRVARDIGMSDFIIVGPGMAKRRSLPNSLYANVFEALIAAVFIDGGMEEAARVVLTLLEGEIAAAEAERRYKNYKSELQHYAQREWQVTPTYRVMREEGPDHLKFFEIVAVINDIEYASGWGRSKKEAEQRAAEETLKALSVSLDD